MNTRNSQTPNHESWPTLGQLLALYNQELGSVDPVVMNLVVAKGIPALGDLEIGRYVRLADQWAADLHARMPALEAEFRQSPADWHNDLDFFWLGLICWYCDMMLGVAYREEQINAVQILYTDPNDLFLTGVMDSLRGTCANLPLLHVVLGRRIGLPVSLACVGSHLICRFDDGVKTINIEATETGRGGFSSQTDEYVLAKHKVSAKAQECGSDLRAVTPREMLGLFLGFRARHLENTRRMAEAEADYLLARHMFPHNRMLYIHQFRISAQCGMDLFEFGEEGHPNNLAHWIQEVMRFASPPQTPAYKCRESLEKCNGNNIDSVFQQIIADGNFI